MCGLAVGAVKSLWVGAKGTQAGFCTEENCPAPVLRSREILLGAVKNPSTKYSEPRRSKLEQRLSIGHALIVLLAELVRSEVAQAFWVGLVKTNLRKYFT
jgi:hypothetical protein